MSPRRRGKLGIREPAPSFDDLSNRLQVILGCATQLLFRIAHRPFIWLSSLLVSGKGTRLSFRNVPGLRALHPSRTLGRSLSLRISTRQRGAFHLESIERLISKKRER